MQIMCKDLDGESQNWATLTLKLPFLDTPAHNTFTFERISLHGWLARLSVFYPTTWGFETFFNNYIDVGKGHYFMLLFIWIFYSLNFYLEYTDNQWQNCHWNFVRALSHVLCLKNIKLQW